MNKNFRDMLAVFNKHHARYLIVGAYAVMRYTEPRYTKDRDVWIDTAPENAARYKALAEFGAPASRYSPEDFEDRYAVFQVGVEPQRIDVTAHIDGVDFSSAWEKRQTSRVEGLTMHFLSREDLIKNKKATGRRQDWIDVDNLTGKT